MVHVAPSRCADGDERAGTLARVEDAGINASAPPQQRWVDGWLVRFSPGKAKRARCIQPVAAGRLPVAEKIALCRPIYREAGLPLLVRITPFSEPVGLDRMLAASGWPRVDDTRVMICPTLDGRASEPLPALVQCALVGHEAFAQVVGALRGSSLAQRQAHAERLANAPVPFTAMVLKRHGDILACGQLAVEGHAVGLYDIFTAPAARGHGLARILCGHLLAHGRSQGARVAYLQVESDNAPARAVYRRLGFTDAYAYHYRVDPDVPGAARTTAADPAAS